MFSARLPVNLAANRLAVALAELGRARTGLLDLTESNPTRAGFTYPAALLQALATDASLRYEPQPLGLAEARRAVADELARKGLAIDPSRIAITASTSEAYSLIFKLLCDPGDEVLVPRPSYPLFEHLTALDAVVAVPYCLEYHGAWSIDFESVRSRLTPRSRAVLVVTPNNPTGSFIKREELEALETICAEHSLALVADEVFADYPIDTGPDGAVSPLTRGNILTFSLGGLSKSAGLPQVKLGWIAMNGPERLVQQALDRLEFIADTYLSVSTPVQHAARALLAAGAGVRAQIQQRIQSNYTSLQDVFRAVPACRVLPAEGGWYAVVQIPATRAEEAWVLELLEEDQVLVHPGFFFDFPREAYLVISLLPALDTFSEAIARISARLSRG